MVIYVFPPFSLVTLVLPKNSGGGGHRTHSSTQVANSTIVADTNENSNSKSPETSSEKGADISSQPDLIHPLHPKLVLLLSCIQEQLESKGL